MKHEIDFNGERLYVQFESSHITDCIKAYTFRKKAGVLWGYNYVYPEFTLRINALGQEVQDYTLLYFQDLDSLENALDKVRRDLKYSFDKWCEKKNNNKKVNNFIIQNGCSAKKNGA